ncbi:MAG: hypothetical protein KAW01_04995, partial [Deltaproteobacteria bacterium]|nr:hypothetical protein [Deltaproteobacteria bacterium]
MKLPFEELRDKIKAENENSKIQTEKHEAAGCWSYAYLSRWVVLERGLKKLYNVHNKERIRAGALAWLEYLDGKTTKAPGKINDFSVDTRKMPPYNLIKELLGTSNSIKTAIDTSGKFREMRNKIAHKAEGLKSEKGYLEFKKTIDKAIT